MSSFDFQGFFDGDWEERGELVWNEHDWQQYLKLNEQEIARFIALYLQHRQQPDHLDTVAHLMGWDHLEWSPASDTATADAAPSGTPLPMTTSTGAAPPSAASGPTPLPIPPTGTQLPPPPAKAPPPADNDDPAERDFTYTIHRHPVFIATRGLYQHLHHVWEHFMGHDTNPVVKPSLAWKFASSLHAGELNAVMAIHALDLGDFALSLCHLKNALSALNHSLSLLQLLPLVNTAYHVQFFREEQATLFDLREIWLRVMQDCRLEHHRRTYGDVEEKE